MTPCVQGRCSSQLSYTPEGGVPAAPSGTATLLRLSPSRRFYPNGLPDSHGLTGGVYKVRERIHRIIADIRLLAIPAS
eukprot:gene41776-51773_t